MYRGKRYRMPVDAFALARGATQPVTSKQEAEKVWEPKFIAEIASGKDPRKVPQRETTTGKPTTVADLLTIHAGGLKMRVRRYRLSPVCHPNEVFVVRQIPELAETGVKSGRGDWIRTSDPLLPKQMRYQAALRPDIKTP